MPQSRTVLRAICLSYFSAVLAAGCTVVSQTPPGETSAGSVPHEVAAKSLPQEGAAAPPEAALARQPAPDVTLQPEAVATQQAAPVDATPAPTRSDDGVSAPGTRRPSGAAAGRAPVTAPDKSAPDKSVATAPPAPKPPTAVAQRPGPPPLDLKSLETRLKETKAIGVYTKLTLKNQVDDLLDDFRAYYKGHATKTLAELRRAFDMLVMKVLALLQDADPQLASAIAASRDAIWGILSDPVKFAAV